MLWKIKSIFNYLFRRFVQVLQLLKFPKIICKTFNDWRHYIILTELHSIFKRSYLYYLRTANFTVNGNNSGIIWTFWWQGYDKMPSLVKACFASLNKYSSGHRIILITKYNVRKYSTIPSYIFNKVDNNCISLTHLSDILRFNLLKQYGGLWIDSTVLCTSDLDSKYFNKLCTFSVGKDCTHSSVSKSKWMSFFIGGIKDEPLFNFMTIFFNLYWRKYNCLIDYFMVDYALYYAYCHNIGNFYHYVNDDRSQPNIFKLIGLMSKPYNKKEYEKLKDNTSMFKLTYKKKFKYRKWTYYYYLLNYKL